MGYALAHAYRAALDNPELVVACVVGDGEAETGPLATSWHANKFVNRERDGAVLPILHLNGYKIANPTVLARIPEAELLELMRGYGSDPLHVAGDDRATGHRLFADTLDHALDVIAAREARPPMIVLRTPKGWTGPEAGSWRSHQVPIPDVHLPGKLAQLEGWLRSYHPEELFDDGGRLLPEIRALASACDRRMTANRYATGGLLLDALPLPNFRAYAVDVAAPAASTSEATR